ncbi:MAG: DNA polymerase III subunit gamma/tau [Chloroflexi bacterium]|nr:DNA polymerase III subunit gamma/tau [Chloroflexota bacterium]
MAQVFYRKWRPQRWDEVVGQQHIVQTLRNALAAGRTAHAYLFAGPRGTGKTTTARLLAKGVNCLAEDAAARPCDACEHCLAVNQGRFLDLIEIDAASNTSVEDVRSLREKINFSPNQGRYKVYIIDEVHMLSTAAFNALLKTLEEPPKHAIFILATTEIHKIPATVLSRCQRHEFRRIPVNEIVARLRLMSDAEGLQVEDAALTLLARQATGSMRDAISLLDHLASTGQTVSLSLAQELLGAAASQSVLDMLEALRSGENAAGLEIIHCALDGGSDPRQFARQIVDALRALLLVRMGSARQVDAPDEMRAQIAALAQAFDVQELLRLIRLFNHAAGEARLAWQPSLPLEFAFIEALAAPAEAAPPRAAAQPARPAPAHEKQAAPEKQAAAKPSAEAAAPGDPLFQQIIANWRQVINIVKGREPKNTAALLNSCKPLGMREGALLLGFNGEITRSKFDEGGHAESTQQAILEVTGAKVPLRTFVAGKGGTLPPEVESDSLVAVALRDLGGELVDMS